MLVGSDLWMSLSKLHLKTGLEPTLDCINHGFAAVILNTSKDGDATDACLVASSSPLVKKFLLMLNLISKW